MGELRFVSISQTEPFVMAPVDNQMDTTVRSVSVEMKPASERGESKMATSFRSVSLELKPFSGTMIL